MAVSVSVIYVSWTKTLCCHLICRCRRTTSERTSKSAAENSTPCWYEGRCLQTEFYLPHVVQTLLLTFTTVFTLELLFVFFTCILILCRCVLSFCVINEYVCALSGVHTAHDIVRHRNDKFNFCVSVVAMSYDIVRYVNTAVKSMCSITATLYDIIRHRTTSYDIVRCRTMSY